MPCSQPQSSYAKVAHGSKVVQGKKKSPSAFWLGQRHVPVPKIRLSPDSEQNLGLSSDDDDNDNKDGDDDTNTQTSRRDASDDDATTTMMTIPRTTLTMIPMIPLPYPLQMATRPLLLPAPLVETIFIWPFQPPILSNRVVTEMLLVAVTLCNNIFLLLTPPHL
jgi:hypothetical protein